VVLGLLLPGRGATDHGNLMGERHRVSSSGRQPG
jgi:hypothetical protein